MLRRFSSHRKPLLLSLLLTFFARSDANWAAEPFIRDEVGAGSWDRFRGENGSGVSAKCQVQIPWTEAQVTSVTLPGSGHGSCVLAGSLAFLISAETKDATRHVIAVDVNKNAIAWTKSYPSSVHKLHKFSSYASSTPCVDNEHVYVAWADPENVTVKALTHAGVEVWSRSLGRYVSQHGFGTSPMLVDGNVVFLNSQDAKELPAGVEPGNDRMIALDCKSGKTAWETGLPTSMVCYGVPCVRRVGDRTELVCSTTSQGMFAMDAKNGSMLWSHDCFKLRVCASALLVGNVLIGSQGSGGGKDNRLVAYDIEAKKELFSITRALSPYVPTPVSSNGLLYLWSDSGIVTCVEMQSGATRWSNRIGGDYSGSPVVLGNKLVNVSHDGVVNVLEASGEFKKLGSIETGKPVRSTIAADTKHLFLRTETELLIVR
jgi:outer membrane protein assembly factor BamB